MWRGILLGLSLSLAALPAAAEAKSVKAAPQPAAKTAAPPRAPSLAVTPIRAARSRTVEVLWGGQWWAAEVMETRAGLSRIHYTGWGNEWDEWVGQERLRVAPPPAVKRPPLRSASVGQRLEVEWHGSWWAAEVIASKNGFYKIHYTGWGNEWDEWVELPRLRSAAGKTTRGSRSVPEIAGAPS
ncbi:MAG: hypothetical protein IPI67_09905 [Myxococcales bacterium]|nr:hypothetical protein [Myxococcales bacterium]